MNEGRLQWNCKETVLNDKHVEHDPASKLTNESGYVFSANAPAVLIDATKHRRMFHVSRKNARRNQVDKWIIWQLFGYCGQDNMVTAIYETNVLWRSHPWNTRLSRCSLLCLKLFGENFGHMLPKFTGACSQQVFNTSEAAIVIPGHQRWSRETRTTWLSTYQLRVSSSSAPDAQRLLSRATKMLKICCDLVGSDKWQDWGHWR